MFNRDILKFFDRWYRKKRRKPLVIRGARQVGKTVAITLFGQKKFKDVGNKTGSGNLFALSFP
jgi:predicted AAA+ superfamily ATPase